MDREIEIAGESNLIFLAWSDWDGELFEEYAKNYPKVDLYDHDDWTDILDKEKRNFERFLSQLKRKYTSFKFDSEPEVTVMDFPLENETLRNQINIRLEIIKYLESRNIPWYMDNLNFNFDNSNTSGIIRFDNDKSFIKIYYLSDNYQFVKLKIPYGVTKKMI